MVAEINRCRVKANMAAKGPNEQNNPHHDNEVKPYVSTIADENFHQWTPNALLIS